MNINFRRSYCFLFFAAILFVLTLPVISSAQWKLALPQFSLDKTNEDFEGLGAKARKILKDEIRSTGLFVIIPDSRYVDLGQKEPVINSYGKKTFDANLQAWRQIGVEWLVKTNYEINKEGALNLTFRLYDINNNRFFIGKRYTTSKIFLKKVVRRYADELVFQITGKGVTAATREKELEVEQSYKSKESLETSFIKRSIANHINQFQSCGFNRDEIKIEKDNRQSSSIIAYVIYGPPRNLECLISKKLKINQDFFGNNLFFYQSLHDKSSTFEHLHSNPDNKEIYRLEEGLIKFDDRLIIFTAPDSEGGIVNITKVSSDSVLVKVAHLINNENYLVSLPALKHKLDNVNLNRVKVAERIDSSQPSRPTLKVKLDNSDINEVNVIRKTNKSNKKIPTGLTAQEREFNIFKQESEREIDNLRIKIKSLRNQLAQLESDQTRSKQNRVILSGTEESSELNNSKSSQQKTTLDNLYKIAKRKDIMQGDRLSSSIEINPADIVVSNLLNWVKSWENQNTPLYFSFYSKNFKDPKRSRSEWETYRRKSIKKSLNISLQVSNIKTSLTKNNKIRTTFVQQYKSNKFSDIGLKELVWEKDHKRWKIIKESWEPR